jgi:hypothetical protein
MGRAELTDQTFSTLGEYRDHATVRTFDVVKH